ncbi:MAG: hypothetical protein SFV23_09110 [Planctomycetaceae bacterium]|nr:hypothetical protein [Planctomycetaceae bacterium]
MTVPTTRDSRSPRQRCIAWLGAVAVLAGAGGSSASDDLPRYFGQLRQRGLFVVAEHYALSRLEDPKLDAGRRTDLVVDLSQTFAEHAWYANPQQRDELWQKALQIVRDELARMPPRAELLHAQEAIVAAARVRGLRWEVAVAPEDGPLRESFQRSADLAARLLERQSVELENSLKQGRRAATQIAPFEQRRLLSALQAELGGVLRDRAALDDGKTSQRASDLVDAEAAFRRGLSGGLDSRTSSWCRLGLADCRRLQGDFPQAREMCAAIAANGAALSPDLIDAVDACRVRCWLDERKPLEGAEYLLGVRQARHVLSGELWFVQLETLLAMRDLAAARQDPALSANLQAEAELALTRVAEQAGGSWARFCRLLWDRDRTQRTYGADLDRLIRTARAEYLGGRKPSAAAAYSSAIVAAEAAQQVELRRELSYTRGSILLETEDFSAAVEEFQKLAAESPPHDRTASSHLLAAYALGRLYDQDRTQARRIIYTEALESHLQRFAEDITSGDARFMLAQLQEQRLQHSKALPLYLAIPADHARYALATLSAARCYETLIRRLEDLGRDSTTFHAEAVAELTRRYLRHADQPAAWTETHGGIALSLARLHLTGSPADYSAAAAILDQYAAARRIVPEVNTAAWRRWDDESLSLRLVALAGTGRSAAARELLSAPATTRPESLLAIVLGLERLARGPATAQFVDLTELLVAAVTRLEPQREQLSAVEQTQFDLARTRAYLMTGRTPEGMAAVTAITERFRRDLTRLRELADALRFSKEPVVLAAALKLWKHIESLEKPGSVGWFSARIEVIEALLLLGDDKEAARLLGVTLVLYPDPADPAVQQRLADLQRRMTAKR